MKNELEKAKDELSAARFLLEATIQLNIAHDEVIDPLLRFEQHCIREMLLCEQNLPDECIVLSFPEKTITMGEQEIAIRHELQPIETSVIINRK